MSDLILTPAFIFPVAAPPVAGYSLRIADGKIAEISPTAELLQKNPDAEHIELFNHILTPGLINAHCHLELGYLRGVIPAGHFVDWVQRLVVEVIARNDNMEAVVAKSVSQGIAELLSGGVTRVGDITKQHAFSRKILREGPIRAVSFGEVAAIGARRPQLAGVLAAAIEASLASETMQIGVSPHAPYTVEGPALRETLLAAKKGELPVCMHLAELIEERQFLADLTGRLFDAWNAFNTAHEILDEKIPRHAGGPIRWAKEYGLFTSDAPLLLAHVNYADDDELAILKQAGASVAYCPRTHTFFGHAPHRFREMLAQQINVCLATDSLASNPDLILMREARHLLRQDAALSPHLLLDMITRRGGIALGLPPDSGTLTTGAPADIAAFPIPAAKTLHSSKEALSRVILGDGKASAIWIAGRKVI